MKSLFLALIFFIFGSTAMLALWSRATVMCGPPPAPPVIVLAQAPPFVVETTPPPAGEREPAAGLPVPIYPGTRVTEAEIRPPAGPRHREPRPVSRPLVMAPRVMPAAPELRSVAGRLSATDERARADARLQLQREVAEWLSPEAPTSWKPPAGLVDRLVVRTQVKPVVRDYGTLYEATLQAELSPARRLELLQAYQHELVAERLGVLAGVFAFVLVCLAALAGYIRADEATKGYYTQSLRAATAAGVGASGVLIYQLLT